MELKGLKINFLGDSITQGVGTSGDDKRFSDILASRYGIISRNYGISGTRFAKQYHPTDYCPSFDLDFVMRAKEMDKDADVVFVFGGTNDFGHGDAPFGSFADRTKDTFCGACHELMSYLEGAYVGKTVVIITPLHRADEEITEGKPTTKPLKEYVKIIKETAEYYSLPVLDLWSNLGLSTNVPAAMDKYIPDGLHPNDAGHEILTAKIAAFLKSL